MTAGLMGRKIDPMQDLGRSIDVWLGELARQRRSPRTRDKYRRHLLALADTLPNYTAVSEISADDCRLFLDRWIDAEASTIGGVISCLRGFFLFLIREGHVAAPGPMDNIERPRRKRSEDLDVVTISIDEGIRMLDACGDWQELLCISTALYTGRRRAALNAARRRDVDLKAGTIRFRDKGDKVIVQPVPGEYAAIVRAADENDVWASPGDYLIPSRRPSTVSRKLRKDSLIWDTVKRVAARAGVESHVHALRGAFAVAFDAAHPDMNFVLQDLMGHTRMESTLVYLRRRNKALGMEAVRDLSWGSEVFAAGFHRDDLENSLSPANAGDKAHTGFEPVFSGDGDPERLGGGPEVSGKTLLERKLDELRARDRAKRKASR